MGFELVLKLLLIWDQIYPLWTEFSWATIIIIISL